MPKGTRKPDYLDGAPQSERWSGDRRVRSRWVILAGLYRWRSSEPAVQASAEP